FSIAKYVSLLLLGVPNEKLRMIYVRARLGGSQIAHMVLGYYAEPTDEPMILDNLIGSIRPASRRPDLVPVFSFNNAGLWVPGATASAADPTARLSRWRDVLEKIRAEGSL
ncbi:MAG: transglutaminase, partial [Quisquiliibacterium sp.]